MRVLKGIIILALPVLVAACQGSPFMTEATVTASVDSSCERAAEQHDFECVTVFYGTNREVADVRMAFGQVDRYLSQEALYGTRPNEYCMGSVAERVPYCSLGIVTVTVPDSHQRGARITSINTGGLTDDSERSDFFTIWGGEELGFADFSWMALNALQEAEGSANENQVLIFIHGFNVSFQSAAFRTAQLKHDLEFPGPAFFYSWPANESVVDYFSDMDDADLSVEALSSFISAIDAITGDAELNLIVHSMGSRVFSQAMSTLAERDPSFRVSNVFLASADLDTTLFSHLMSTNDVSRRIETLTIYTSSNDRAVQLSRALRNFTLFGGGVSADPKFRVGVFERNDERSVWNSVFDFQLMDDNFPTTIDTTQSRDNHWLAEVHRLRDNDYAHSVFAENSILIQDMSCLLRTGIREPHRRNTSMALVPFPVDEQDNASTLPLPGAQRYWRFRGTGQMRPACR